MGLCLFADKVSKYFRDSVTLQTLFKPKQTERKTNVHGFVYTYGKHNPHLSHPALILLAVMALQDWVSST